MTTPDTREEPPMTETTQPDAPVLDAAWLETVKDKLVSVRQYRVFIDDDGDLQLAGDCAETLGCLFSRFYPGELANEHGVTLGALIDAALTHAGPLGDEAHAYLAGINGEPAS